MKTIDRSRRSFFVMSAVILAGVLPATEAIAHAELKSSSPSANASVAPPTNLTLTFSEGISLSFSGATIVGPDKVSVKTGAASLDAKSAAVLIVPIADALKGGKYTVNWHNLSNDGHKLKGNFSFTVK